jgi:ATP-binding cassette subfamily B protein
MAQSFFQRIRTAIANLGHLPAALKLVWQAVPGWTTLGLVLIAVQGLLPAAVVYLTKIVVDRMVAIGGNAGGSTFGGVLIPGAVIAGLLLANELLSSLSRYVRAAQAEHLHDHIRNLIHDQAIAADLAFYEQPEYHDHLYRARDESAHRSVELVASIGTLLQSGITLVAMGAVLLPYGAWLPIALLLSTGPAFVVVLRFSLRLHDWRKRNTPDERQSWYYDAMLTGAEAAPELRLFQLGQYFKERYAAVRNRLRDQKLALARDQGVAEFTAALLGLCVTGAVMAWMVWRVVHGQGTLGDLALFYQAFYQGQSLMRSLLSSLGQLYANSLFLGDLFAYLALRPAVVDPPDPLITGRAVSEGLSFARVTFSYPGSERPALTDFDLRIPAGQIAAVVGANGAGKSTLVKLLCRFYDPQQGTVAIDGADLRRLPLQEVRRSMAVLFQDPMHYNATAAENIAVGREVTPAELDRARTAAGAAGADTIIEKLPDGYAQLLGRWFAGGAELSAGEWQRIALARAFLRDSPILLLDEPTSAMDPWAEAAWLQRFRTIAEGRTAVIITHRFTTARYADIIHVLDHGRVVESGTHEELLAQASQYAASWTEQTGSFADRSVVGLSR